MEAKLVGRSSLVEETHFKKEKWFKPGDNAPTSNGRVKISRAKISGGKYQEEKSRRKV